MTIPATGPKMSINGITTAAPVMMLSTTPRVVMCLNAAESANHDARESATASAKTMMALVVTPSTMTSFELKSNLQDQVISTRNAAMTIRSMVFTLGYTDLGAGDFAITPKKGPHIP